VRGGIYEHRSQRRLTRRFPLRGASAPLGPHIRCDLSVSASSADTCLRSSEARARLTRKDDVLSIEPLECSFEPRPCLTRYGTSETADTLCAIALPDGEGGKR
jgi:hypothetical protein